MFASVRKHTNCVKVAVFVYAGICAHIIVCVDECMREIL